MIYLQFPDESTARVTTGWWGKKSGWAAPTPALQIAVRGVQFDDAEYDDSGNMTKPPAPQPGFHIDVIYGEIPEAARQYIVTPAEPDFVLA